MTNPDNDRTQPVPTVASPIVAHLIRFAEHVHVPGADVLGHAKLTAAEVENPEGYLPALRAVDAWDIVSQERPRTAIGLACAENAAAAAGPIAYKAAFEATGRRALQTFLKYRSLASSHLQLSCRSSGRFHVMRIEHLSEVESSGHPVDFSMSIIAGIVCGSFRDGLRRTSFKHAPFGSRKAYCARFGDQIRFEAERTELWFEEEMLDTIRPHADPSFARFLESCLDRRLSLAPPDPAPDDIAQAVQAAAGQGDYRVEAVAKALKLGVRTLQRRARATHRDIGVLLDQARHERALRLLEGPELTLADIAEALDYADERSFSRAFRRWTGQSPGRWRASTHRMDLVRTRQCSTLARGEG